LAFIANDKIHACSELNSRCVFHSQFQAALQLFI
jgi:hypothetical protein